MLNSDIFQVLDLSLPRQLMGAAVRVTGLARENSRSRPLKACSKAYMESSLNFMRKRIDTV